jgi:hypothetical protein
MLFCSCRLAKKGSWRRHHRREMLLLEMNWILDGLSRMSRLLVWKSLVLMPTLVGDPGASSSPFTSSICHAISSTIATDHRHHRLSLVLGRTFVVRDGYEYCQQRLTDLSLNRQITGPVSSIIRLRILLNRIPLTCYIINISGTFFLNNKQGRHCLSFLFII